MTAPGAEEVQARIRLSALLFRAAMPRLAKALAAAGEAPPRPEEKEALLARLETAAWTLGPEVLRGPDDAGWEERAVADPSVEAALAGAIGEIAGQRRKR